MNTKIQSVKFDADKKLLDFIEGKLAKMERFAEKAVSCEVILKLDKDDEKGNKVAVIKLAMPTQEIVAESQQKSFEEAVDSSIDALKKQIEKYKAKFK